MILLGVVAFTAFACALAVAVIWLLAAALARALAPLADELRWRRRRRRELPRDWWERFEADLRAYSSRAWRAAREAERRA